MGGLGSTRWAWHTKATTVEECRSLSVSELHDEGFFDKPGRTGSGSISWSNFRGDEVASIDFAVGIADGDGNLDLRYAASGVGMERRIISYTVPLQTTRPNYGGLRWWFTCPFCDRRVGKLYLPPNETRFLCRHCHKLSYKKCQESDQRVSNMRKLGPWGILEKMQDGSLDSLITGMKALPDWVWLAGK